MSVSGLGHVVVVIMWLWGNMQFSWLCVVLITSCLAWSPVLLANAQIAIYCVNYTVWMLVWYESICETLTSLQPSTIVHALDTKIWWNNFDYQLLQIVLGLYKIVGNGHVLIVTCSGSFCSGDMSAAVVVYCGTTESSVLDTRYLLQHNLLRLKWYKTIDVAV